MPLDRTVDVLDDIPTLRDIPLGDLHKIAVANKLDAKAAKSVLKSRVEFLARKAGFPAGFSNGPCNGEHGTTVGVRPETAGVMWSYVRILLHFLTTELNDEMNSVDTTGAGWSAFTPFPKI